MNTQEPETRYRGQRSREVDDGPIDVSEELVGTRIRRHRRRIGLNQQAVAREVGVTQPAISNIERGVSVPSVELRHRLARLFDISTAELMMPVPGPPLAQVPKLDQERTFVRLVLDIILRVLPLAPLLPFTSSHIVEGKVVALTVDRVSAHD